MTVFEQSNIREFQASPFSNRVVLWGTANRWNHRGEGRTFQACSLGLGANPVPGQYVIDRTFVDPRHKLSRTPIEHWTDQ